MMKMTMTRFMMDYAKYLYVLNQKQLQNLKIGIEETSFEGHVEHDKFEDFVLDYHKCD